MTTATTVSVREPQLQGQTVVVIGDSSGIGLETARRARAEGAAVVLTGRNPERLQHAARELDALSSAAFDATDFVRLKQFFDELRAGDRPGSYYAPLAELDFEKARRSLDAHLFLPLHVARNAVGRVRPGGTLLFMSGAKRHQAGITTSCSW